MDSAPVPVTWKCRCRGLCVSLFYRPPFTCVGFKSISVLWQNRARMKLTAPDGSWWVELRGPTELNGADRRALEEVDDEINGLGKGIWLGDDGEEFDLAPDGVTMVRRVARRKLSREILNRRRDALLSRLISNWSFAGLPLPYQPGYLDSETMPLDAVNAIEKTLNEVRDRLSGDGPKESSSADSSTTSRESSAVPLTDSPQPTAAPPSGSAATGA